VPEPAPAPANNAPVISGSPAGSVVAGSGYSFLPVSSDADGDRLTFTISGKPAWAVFDTANGRLSGTPGDSDAGTWRNIVIAVSDGMDTTRLSAFSITVSPVQSQLGSYTLTWTAPVARADGSPLSLADIVGYRVHYGTTAGSYTNTVDINDGSATTTTVKNIPAGTYYVVMTSYDTGGRVSAYSPAIVKVAR
jgi:hypothetical protein